VRVSVDPEATLEADTLTNEFATETGPGFTCTVGKLEVTDSESIVAVMVEAVPDVVPVKVAVYVPLLLSITPDIVPAEEPPLNPNVTAEPPTVILLFDASRA
jgi:hypothetical protein